MLGEWHELARYDRSIDLELSWLDSWTSRIDALRTDALDIPNLIALGLPHGREPLRLLMHRNRLSFHTLFCRFRSSWESLLLQCVACDDPLSPICACLQKKSQLSVPIAMPFQPTAHTPELRCFSSLNPPVMHTLPGLYLYQGFLSFHCTTS